MNGATPERLVVAITGATGAIFGVRLLQRLREFDVESHLVISAWGSRTIKHETSYAIREVQALAHRHYKPQDLGATISSGSYLTMGMVVAPCSMKTLSAISSGHAGDLIARAADVTLKERRKLVLMVRESPLSEIHLSNMLKLARMGVDIFPPVPAFYTLPKTIDDLVDHTITRVLDQFRLESTVAERWDGVVRRRPRGK